MLLFSGGAFSLSGNVILRRRQMSKTSPVIASAIIASEYSKETIYPGRNAKTASVEALASSASSASQSTRLETAGATTAPKKLIPI